MGSYLEYQGPAYQEAGGVVGLGGLLGGLAVLALGERFLRANGMRPLVLVGVAGGALPLVVAWLLDVLKTGPNLHGLAILGWLGFLFCSEACALLLLIGGAARIFQKQ